MISPWFCDDGRAENCSMHFPHFPRPCGAYVAKSQEGGAVMSMDGVYSAKSQEGGAVMSMDGRYSAKSQEGGAVLFSNLATEKCHLKKAYYDHAGFVYA